MSEEKHYSTPEAVIADTGLRPRDMRIEEENENGDSPEEQLKELIRGWLIEIKDIIDHHRGRDYHQEVEEGKRSKVPPGIHMIARQMAGNMVSVSQQRLKTPIVRQEDLSVITAMDSVLTNNVEKQLELFPRKARIGMKVMRKRKPDEEA